MFLPASAYIILAPERRDAVVAFLHRVNPKQLLFSLRWSLLRIWALFRNEIESLLKDKQSLLIIFLVPLAVMVPFYRPPGEDVELDSMMPFSLSVNDGPYFGVLDLDTTDDWEGVDMSRNFSSTFHMIATEYLSLDFELLDLQDYNHGITLLKEGQIIGFLVVPLGFEKNLTDRVTTNVVLVIDATELELSASLTAAMEISIALFKFSHGLIRDEIYPLSFQQFKAESPLFSAGPLIFSILIFGAAMLLTSQCIVGDEPLRRTLLTPAGKLEVIAAKTIAYSGIHAVQVQLMLFVAMTIFRLPVYGAFHVSFLMLFMIAFCGIAMGMFVSVLSKTRLQANQMFLLVFIMFLLALIFITDPAITNWMPMYQGVNGFTTYAYKGFDFALKPWPMISTGIVSAAFMAATILAFHFKKTVE